MLLALFISRSQRGRLLTPKLYHLVVQSCQHISGLEAANALTLFTSILEEAILELLAFDL